ncbi:MAG: peptidase, partial [Rhizobiales bacterium]|nr:peptidase [Hyphomicrobiales bacterium]
MLNLVSYAAPLGANAAYVSPRPADGKKHPAIIWLVGGFSNSIGGIAWTPGPRENDQSASAFRDHGILMLYPSLRGGNTNPGHLEAFFG